MQEPDQRREPRFVYLSDALPNAPVDDDAPRGRVTRYGWRLDAANHRPLGRAATLSSSFEACRTSAAEVRERIAELTIAFTPDSARSVWTWRLERDGVVVAVSAHAYLRRVECVRAHGQFAAALESADPGLGVLRNFGPRALRAFGPHPDIPTTGSADSPRDGAIR